MFYNQEAKYLRSLKTFGEMGVVKDHSKSHKAKLDDRGITCMLTEYAADHAGDVYRM